MFSRIDPPPPTLRHLGYICTIVNGFFEPCIKLPPLSLFHGYGSHACSTKIRNVSTARFKEFPAYPYLPPRDKPNLASASTNGSELLYLTVVVSTSSRRRWKVDLLFLFEKGVVFIFEKGYLVCLGS